MKYMVGIDEVGRGPLAGPVTIGIVVCEEKLYIRLKRTKRLPKTGFDSKKLCPADREKYSRHLKSLAISSPTGEPCGRGNLRKFMFATIHISNKIIDEIGISYAVKKAIGHGVKRLKLNPEKCAVLLDGGLKAPIGFLKQKTIIKGDQKEKIISWASILAKVSRDALMCRLAKRYPQYGFEIHKGYGTKKHREAIRKYGLSEMHRKSFCKSLADLSF